MLNYKQVLKFIEGMPGIYNVMTNMDKSILSISNIYGQAYIMFEVEEKDMEGLFYLTRCICIRYSNLKKWSIEIDCTDSLNDNGDRPLYYILCRKIDSDDVISEDIFNNELDELYDNLSNLYDNKNFMKYFKMNPDKYKNIKETQFSRKLKLDYLLNDQ